MSSSLGSSKVVPFASRDLRRDVSHVRTPWTTAGQFSAMTTTHHLHSRPELPSAQHLQLEAKQTLCNRFWMQMAATLLRLRLLVSAQLLSRLSWRRVHLACGRTGLRYIWALSKSATSTTAAVDLSLLATVRPEKY
jgi:hypothetical protein